MTIAGNYPQNSENHEQNILYPNPPAGNPVDCKTMQQQKSVQPAECNKIHQMKQWFFCSLLRGNNFLHWLHLVALNVVRFNEIK